jgi:Uma2 family endonuclease
MSFAVMNDLLPRHRITVDEYYRMAEVGLIAPDARTELIEGEVIGMPPMGSPHAATVSLLMCRLAAGLGRLDQQVRVQLPVRLDVHSEPLPDFAVVLSREDLYRSRHPLPADTLLVVEISQSTLRLDLKVKVPLYARHQVPEVWVVDIEHHRIHFFRSPKNGIYTEVSFTDKPGVVVLASLPEVKIDLSALFTL